jgi:hypothetical protein
VAFLSGAAGVKPEVREMLDRRSDDLESGKVKARLRAKSDSRRAGLS